MTLPTRDEVARQVEDRFEAQRKLANAAFNALYLEVHEKVASNVLQNANAYLQAVLDALIDSELRHEADQVRIQELREALLRVISESWYVLSGGDDPSDKCMSCGLAGHGELRSRLKEAEALLSEEKK